MMATLGLRNKWLLYFVALLATVSSELPGLFSGSICNSPNQQAFQPWCTCRQSLNIGTDIRSWCSSYEAFSSCVESGLETSSKGSYLSHVFNKTLMDKNMAFLCDESNLDKSRECYVETKTCQDVFVAELTARPSWNESTSCKTTERLASCLWMNKACPVKLKHLLAELADSYTGGTCAKYFSKSVGEKCVSNRKNLYPNSNDIDTCLLGARYQQECMNRKAVDSHHGKDRFYTMDLDGERILIYETFRCRNKYEHSRSQCLSKGSIAGSKCSKKYKQSLTAYIAAIQRGDNIPIGGICRFYEETSDCFKKAHSECQVQSDHILALLCSAIPKSCPCPLQLEQVGRSSGRNTASCHNWKDVFLKQTLLLVWVGMLLLNQ